MSANSYDYIVIGSGSAGAVIAARLSENGKYSVLCLEAGKRGAGYFWSGIPAGANIMFDDAEVNWCYHSEADESHGSRRLFVPRGKMLGGSSAMNGMIYNRGQPVDYNTWAQMGCRGWSYEDVLPLFRKLESTDIGSDEYRGRDGPIRVTNAPKLSRFYDLFIEAAQAVGIPHTFDYSGTSQEGVSVAQQTIFAGRRQSTATQYLKPARNRRNLTILTRSEATSLILDGARCTGVRYVRDGVAAEAHALREVIVSCGTANSPKLLELSGIGAPETLREAGIEVAHELPGVGENLRDHYAAALHYRLNEPGISLAERGHGWRLVRELMRYALFRTGLLSLVFGSLRAFTRSQPGLDHPDIMLMAVPFLIDMRPGWRRGPLPIEAFSVNGHVLRTESSGSIHIRSSNPAAAPTIRFRFLATDPDRRAAIAVVRRIRELVRAPPLSAYVAEEMHPGPDMQTDEQILNFIRHNGQTTFHMVGTCRMGTDAMAVVDERLRVRGLEGLRVADASIMPTITSGNTNIPSIMIGEKCAQMIREDAIT